MRRPPLAHQETGWQIFNRIDPYRPSKTDKGWPRISPFVTKMSQRRVAWSNKSDFHVVLFSFPVNLQLAELSG
jgi:hypothetical protein